MANPIASFLKCLADMGQVGWDLRGAMKRSDEPTGWAALHRARGIRAKIARVRETVRETIATTEGASEMPAINALMPAVQQADAAILEWCSRPASPSSAIPRAVANLLGPTWDVTRDVVVMVGIDRAMVRALLDVGQRRIFIEAGESERTDDLPAGLILVRGDAGIETAAVLLPPPAPERVAHYQAATSAPTEPGRRERICEAVQSGITSGQWSRNSVARFGETWVRHGMANLPALAQWPAWPALRPTLAGRPIVIIGPGPSLTRNVAQLRALKGRAVLLAVSHSLGALDAAGIVPDLVLAVDHQGEVLDHFAYPWIGDVEALLLGFVVHPDLWRLPAQRRFTVAGSYPLEQWAFAEARPDLLLANRGSVSHVAWSIAMRLGCNPVILVGHDHALTDGRTYAAESRCGVTDGVDVGADFRAWSRVPGASVTDTETLEVPGWGGGTVLTSQRYDVFRHFFEHQVAALAGRVRMINATEGGAHIAGMEHLSLDKATADFAPFDVKGAIAGAADSHDQRRARREVLTHVEHVASSMQGIAHAANYCDALALKAVRKPRLVGKLIAEEEALRRTIAGQPLFDMLCSTVIDAATMQSGEETDLAGSLDTLRGLHAALRGAAEFVRPLLGEAKRVLLEN